MAGIKSLAKDTAIYGLSSIIGRFLNWCLVPLYTYVFPENEYGIVSYLYSFTAVALVILNYGMETGFFRYANREDNPEKVYSTSLISVGFTSILFILLMSVFINPVSELMLLPQHPLYVWLLAVTVAIDAFSNLPFAYLRYKNKALKFATIKCINVVVNICLNLFFILLCPIIQKSMPEAIDWFYAPLGGEDFGIGWIFVANIISTLVVLLLLLPQVVHVNFIFDGKLLKKMLNYSWPLLILGIAGILSQNMGQMIIPYIFTGNETDAHAMVGIYSANMKIALVMVMFTQAFRYAYEPFIFARAKNVGEDKGQAYCDAMKFFIIFGFLIFLGVMFYLPVLKRFISPAYWSGLQVVPVMMLAELCFGVFFNLSLWYKLTDRTQWGMYFSLTVFVIMLLLNLWLVPLIGIPNGYMGSAWAALISYALITIVSWWVGKKYYPLPYQWKRIFIYAVVAAVLLCAGMFMTENNIITYIVRTIAICIYILVVAWFEPLPIISNKIHSLLKKH